MRTEDQIENPILGQQEMRLHAKHEWLKDVAASAEEQGLQTEEASSVEASI